MVPASSTLRYTQAHLKLPTFPDFGVRICFVTCICHTAGLRPAGPEEHVFLGKVKMCYWLANAVTDISIMQNYLEEAARGRVHRNRRVPISAVRLRRSHILSVAVQSSCIILRTQGPGSPTYSPRCFQRCRLNL
jgi:hypothetical protein